VKKLPRLTLQILFFSKGLHACSDRMQSSGGTLGSSRKLLAKWRVVYRGSEPADEAQTEPRYLGVRGAHGRQPTG
jgi:hypothetical protein